MKTLISKTVITFVLLFAAFSSNICSQVFKGSALITIPGNNIEYDISSPGFLQHTATYICWVNVLDSVYTVYFKQITPVMGNNIVVASDSGFKSKPVIAGYDRDIRITWQSKNNYWRVFTKHFINEQPVDSALLLDSLTTEPQITSDCFRFAWIDNGRLYVRQYSQPAEAKLLVDSVNCTSPRLYKLNEPDINFLLYEKDYADSSKIYLFTDYGQGTPRYEYQTVSNGQFSRNPHFGLDKGISFETFANNVWKSVGFEFHFLAPPFPSFTSRNTTCSFTNPVMFSYPIPVTDKSNFTMYFLLFESDSLPDNKEILLNTFLYAYYDSLVNISDSPGNDYLPGTAYMADTIKIYIAVFWEHDFNGKTDIWMAKDVFNPITGNIESTKPAAPSFNLQQNYPNPFNPSTTITYSISKRDWVQISIFDILGRQAAILVNEIKEAGEHSIHFNANSLPSGVYFYRLQSGGHSISRKFILIK